MIVDSHCHIDGDSFDADRDDVVDRAKEAGVAAMLVVGTGDPHSGEIEKAVATAEKYENVFASVGVHPHDAKLYDDKAEKHLIDLVRSSEKVIAWGEIGLDFYYDHSPRDVQKEVFRRQINIARETDLPIIVHSRDANDETVEILTEVFADRGKWVAGSGGLNASHQPSAVSRQPDIPQAALADEGVSSRGIMHCFGGTPEMAKALINLGFLISFAGNVTFKKAEDLRKAAEVVPLEKLLVETDCPFLTPVPMRGKRNEPAYVVHTTRFLADFYGVPFETLAAQTTKNFINLFRLGNQIGAELND